ncbi:AI-2E family transporter [candidate division KSB1 bacterium]|nr:AI-2E family transporter [candidate division KSB1 bacterium]
MLKNKFELYEVFIIICATILLTLYFYELRQILIPPLLAIILVLFFLPFRDHPYARRLIFIIVAIFVFWFIRDTLDILTPFAIAFALSYLFDPLVTKLERKRVPRIISVIAIVTLSLAFFTFAFLYSVPRIINELRNLLAFAMEIPPRIADWLNSEGAGMFARTKEDAAKIQQYLNREIPLRISQFSQSILNSILNFVQTLPMRLGKIVYLILTPFLFFYILKDFTKVKRWIKELLPIETSWVVKEYVDKVDDIIAGFFRGQFIVCTIVGILTSIVLIIFGVEYALLLGMLAGAMNIVPYVGLAITLFIGILIGITSPHPILTCVKIIIAIEGVRIVEGSLLAPRIVGDRVGLHPVWVIFSILIFAHFLGVVGLIIAVPVAATIKIFISVYMHTYRRKIWRRKK